MIDELGPITKTPATYDEEGNEKTPAVIVDGHHVNLRAYGQFAKQVTYGLPQEGDVFERTHLLQIIQDLDFKPITEEGVPAGYEGPNGVRLFDPRRGELSTPGVGLTPPRPKIICGGQSFRYRLPRHPDAVSGKPSAHAGSSQISRSNSPTSPKPFGTSVRISS